MKTRSILVALLVLCLVCALSACGGPALSGRYVITDVIDDPEGAAFADMESMYKAMDLDIADYLYFEFKDNGRFTLVMFGEEEAKGAYTRDGETLTLTSEGRTTTAEIKGKKIIWTYDSGGKLVFEKR